MFFIQMSGFPGSGKTTLAQEIARRTGFIIVDHDITKSALMESMEEGKMSGKEIGKAAYNIDFAFVDFYLAQGRSVILDSPCLYDEIIEKGTTIATKYGATYKYVECYADDFHEINKRLKNRERKISQIAGVASEEVFNKTILNSKKPENIQCYKVNTLLPMESYIEEVMTYLQSNTLIHK
jgi:predicted kinase